MRKRTNLGIHQIVLSLSLMNSNLKNQERIHNILVAPLQNWTFNFHLSTKFMGRRVRMILRLSMSCHQIFQPRRFHRVCQNQFWSNPSVHHKKVLDPLKNQRNQKFQRCQSKLLMQRERHAIRKHQKIHQHNYRKNYQSPLKNPVWKLWIITQNLWSLKVVWKSNPTTLHICLQNN